LHANTGTHHRARRKDSRSLFHLPSNRRVRQGYRDLAWLLVRSESCWQKNWVAVLEPIPNAHRLYLLSHLLRSAWDVLGRNYLFARCCPGIMEFSLYSCQLKSDTTNSKTYMRRKMHKTETVTNQLAWIFVGTTTNLRNKGHFSTSGKFQVWLKQRKRVMESGEICISGFRPRESSPARLTVSWSTSRLDQTCIRSDAGLV